MQSHSGKGFKTLVIATSCFGMGIDVPDCTLVINYGLCTGVADFVQQSGRAVEEMPQLHISSYR